MFKEVFTSVPVVICLPLTSSVFGHAVGGLAVLGGKVFVEAEHTVPVDVGNNVQYAFLDWDAVAVGSWSGVS